jgi:hypothetical protein
LALLSYSLLEAGECGLCFEERYNIHLVSVEFKLVVDVADPRRVPLQIIDVLLWRLKRDIKELVQNVCKTAATMWRRQEYDTAHCVQDLLKLRILGSKNIGLVYDV